ncbi:iron uptake porin [Chroococcidiopsis sp. CCNUC1]|uniref:iron uptake porin n=1 Tax=Chroococcidiopsis sp. CCNUC1 TaxID=2653189 RepID=UPI00202233A7|nr:iron uptake porin [Chroococcidiopsis sp. CCNUC1]URD53360.1 iron uptake porin [Chroococcidiopsis sp. CCNUC1]
MAKSLWYALRLSPVILGTTLFVANSTQAAEAPVTDLTLKSSRSSVTAVNRRNTTTSNFKEVAAFPASEVEPEEKAGDTLESQTQVQTSGELGENTRNQLNDSVPATDMLAQVTSVSQLSDVQPTDWAFQALQSLVERYGCIAGYPDGTYRGNRALTRYEFAAGLNACLDRVNELIATATADMVNREDLATLQRLQEEFSAELATLRGRVDALEARTAELEANQFSTTTTLSGEIVVAAADVFGDERAVRSGEAEGSRGDLDINTILADRARLSFNTSFTGKDLLRTRLQARNITPFTRTGTPGASGDTGTAMTRLSFDGSDSNDVVLDDFFYRFPVGDIAEVKVDFANSDFFENMYNFNPVLEGSGNGAISNFGRFNPIYRQQGTVGSALTVNINPKGRIGLSLGYKAPNSNNPGNSFGLFNGDYAAIAQLAFRPSDALNLGLTYAHSYDNAVTDSVTTSNNISVSGGTGSNFANNPFDNAATSANHYAAQANLKLGERITISGWGGYTVALNENSPSQSADIWNWAATLAIQDLGKEGSVLGLIFGQPPRAASNDFGGRRDQDTSYHAELLYRFPITDNIEVTPGAIVIFNPEHNNDNSNIYVGTIRTTFKF